MIHFDKLLRDDALDSRIGRDGLFFYDSPDLDFRRTLKFVQDSPKLEFVDSFVEDRDGVIWDVHFTFCGRQFLIETNHHGTASAFIVNDPDCPIEVLIDLLSLFALDQRMSWDMPDTQVPEADRGFVGVAGIAYWAIVLCLILYALALVFFTVENARN